MFFVWQTSAWHLTAPCSHLPSSPVGILLAFLHAVETAWLFWISWVCLYCVGIGLQSAAQKSLSWRTVWSCGRKTRVFLCELLLPRSSAPWAALKLLALTLILLAPSMAGVCKLIDLSLSLFCQYGECQCLESVRWSSSGFWDEAAQMSVL